AANLIIDRQGVFDSPPTRIAVGVHDGVGKATMIETYQVANLVGGHGLKVKIVVGRVAISRGIEKGTPIELDVGITDADFIRADSRGGSRRARVTKGRGGTRIRGYLGLADDSCRQAFREAYRIHTITRNEGGVTVICALRESDSVHIRTLVLGS